jgi:hypothetical protein
VIVVPLLAAVKLVGAYSVVNELVVVIVDVPRLFWSVNEYTVRTAAFDKTNDVDVEDTRTRVEGILTRLK